MSLKLYRVICRGMTSSVTGPNHGCRYVVAENPSEAYATVRADLDRRDLGFNDERELDSIHFIAEDVDYPCRYRLHLPQSRAGGGQ